MTRVLVCTPTYNEAQNISELLHHVREALPDADVLVLDDNSPDGTADVAEKVAAEVGAVEVLRRPSKRGLGDAYRAGFAVGIAHDYEVIVQIDADLSHDPAVLPDLIGALDGGAALSIGSRYVPGGSTPFWPWRRRALSRYGNIYTAFMLHTGVHDNSAGFRAFKTDTLKAVKYETTRAKGYGFQIELCYRVARWGGRTEEVPITFTDRVRGTSKMSLSVMAEEMLLISWWGIRDRIRAARGTGPRATAPTK